MSDISKPPIKSYSSYWELHTTYIYFYKCMIITSYFPFIRSYVNIDLVFFILQRKDIRYEDDTFFYMLFFSSYKLQVTNYITLYIHVW